MTKYKIIEVGPSNGGGGGGGGAGRAAEGRKFP